MKPTPDRKRAGVLVPVFAMRSETDLGIGDTEAVKQAIDWCARHGFRVLQMLPINETGGDHSPYNAVSALALDPVTIAVDPAHLPHLTRPAYDAAVDPGALAGLRHGPVQYRPVKALKRQLLGAAGEHFLRNGTARERAEFRAFADENAAWLGEYALFRTLVEEHRANPRWEGWPADHQNPSVARDWLARQPREKRGRLEQSIQCFEYVQWIADRQWREVRRHADARGVWLMGDIPFGVARCSADVWAHRELFDLDWSGGAPPEGSFRPDPFTARWGQNWGVPLYRWDAHRREKFDWWRLRVQRTSRYFHLFRIDHVLGFYRIYAFPWAPTENGKFEELGVDEAREKTGGQLPRFWPAADDTDEHRQANRNQGDELLRMILEAAGDTVVVAEDLGMVPDYVRPHLQQLGIPGFKVPQWERNDDYTYRDGSQYPRLSLVTPATHDHEPLAAMWRTMWREHDDARLATDAHRAHITWLELQRFVWWCGWDGQNIPRDFTPELHEAWCRRVLQANSWLAIFLITDVFAGEARFNVPGPVADSNWSARLDLPFRELDRNPHYSAKSDLFERLIRETGRGD